MPHVLRKGRHEPYDPSIHGPAARLMPSPNEKEIARILDFLDQFSFTADQYWQSYPFWSRGEKLEYRWNTYSGLGGTYTMKAIMWYQHIHRPGSTVYRPSIILDALVRMAIKGAQ